jgi:hypothetical protein
MNPTDVIKGPCLAIVLNTDEQALAHRNSVLFLCRANFPEDTTVLAIRQKLIALAPENADISPEQGHVVQVYLLPPGKTTHHHDRPDYEFPLATK